MPTKTPDKILDTPSLGPVAIYRSLRRSLALQITPDGTVKCRAPRFASWSAIEQFILDHTDWAQKNRQKLRARHDAVAPLNFADGAEFWYLGQSYLLQTCADRTGFDGVKLLVAERASVLVARKLKSFYRQTALTYLQKRTAELAGQYNFSYAKVGISNAKQRWGSCSRLGNLHFAWQLIMAAPELIDYVIIHELAHTRHLDHSPAFWREVAAILPNWKQLRKELQASSAHCRSW